MSDSLRVSHRAYGYTVWANRRVTGLVAAPHEPGPSIEVRLQERPEPGGDAAGSAWPAFYVSPFVSAVGDPVLRAWFHASAESYRLRSSDGTECVVHQSGQRLGMTWPESAPDPEEFLLGTGLAFALRLRGELCLHASSVAIDGRAVLFAGPSHAGKSTVAAALGVRGHAVITDDVAVLTQTTRGVSVQPGGCRLRLRRDAVSIVQDQAPREVSFVASPGHAYVDLPLDQSSVTRSSAPTPVEAICFLQPDPHAESSPRAEELSRADALIALVADSWAARLQDRAMRRREFELASDLVDRVRVTRVRYRPDANATPLCECIRHDLAAGGVARS